MYSYAAHDYSDETPSEQIEEWIEDSEGVDEWIVENEVQIDNWLKSIILDQKEQIYQYLCE